MKPPKNFYSNLDRRKQGLPELPEASASDVGKIVKVGSGGAYELGQDAGAKVLAITLASDFTANKTYTEILASLNNGDIVKLTDWTGHNYIYSGMTSGRICFAYLNGYVNTNESDVYTIAVDDTNTWNMFLDTITHLPNVSSSDAGKVLGVDSNGAWEVRNDTFIITAVADANPHPTTLTFEKPINEIVADLVANAKHNCLVIGKFPKGSYNAPKDFVYHIDTYQEASDDGTTIFYDNFVFHRIVKNYSASNKIQLEEFTLTGIDTSLSVNVDSFNLT